MKDDCVALRGCLEQLSRCSESHFTGSSVRISRQMGEKSLTVEGYNGAIRIMTCNDPQDWAESWQNQGIFYYEHPGEPGVMQTCPRQRYGVGTKCSGTCQNGRQARPMQHPNFQIELCPARTLCLEEKAISDWRSHWQSLENKSQVICPCFSTRPTT